MDVVGQEGATFFDHNRPPFTAVALEYQPEADVHGPQASVMVNPRVLTYDTLIALNQLKVHQTDVSQFFICRSVGYDLPLLSTVNSEGEQQWRCASRGPISHRRLS